MSASQSGNFNFHEFTDLGAPLASGRLYTYAFGTTTQKTAYTDHAAAIPHTYTSDGLGGQYIALNARGELPAPLYLSAGSYDLTLRTAAGATMWTYQIEGHEFVGINAPGLETTWVYDAAMQQWHERAEWDAGWQPLRSRLVTAFAGEHFAGDAYGKVTRLDAGINNLSGRVLVRERTWPHLMQPSMEPICFLGLELAMKSGAGGNVTLEISNDGGITFGPKLLRSLGAIGRWMQRIRWLGLGTAINRVFRIRCSDDVPFAIHAASVDT